MSEDGRVAGVSAQISGQALDEIRVEPRRLAGGQVAGDDDRLLGDRGEVLHPALGEVAEDPPLEVVDVGDAVAEVAVFVGQELPRETGHDRKDRELGRDVLAADRVVEALSQRGVGQHAQVEGEDLRQLFTQGVGGALPQVGDLLGARVQSLVQTGQLVGDGARGHRAPRHGLVFPTQHHRAADGHAGRHRDTAFDLHGASVTVGRPMGSGPEGASRGLLVPVPTTKKTPGVESRASCTRCGRPSVGLTRRRPF